MEEEEEERRRGRESRDQFLGLMLRLINKVTYGKGVAVN
jgi:hypothetical protein